MNRPEYHRFLTEVSRKRLRGASSCLPDFSGTFQRVEPTGRREAVSDGRRGCLGGEGEWRCSGGFGGEVSGSAFAASRV